MSQIKRIVLDANILIRAVLGEKVRSLLECHSDHVEFYTPEQCFNEAERHLPVILSRYQYIDVSVAMDALVRLRYIVQSLEPETYALFEQDAKKRIAERDPDDWPVVAIALLLNCPIWTEDKDFFGIGIATWQTQHIQIYLG